MLGRSPEALTDASNSTASLGIYVLGAQPPTPAGPPPKIYNLIIDQFDVENNPRYKKDTYTYCNIFVKDVIMAMGVSGISKGDIGAGNMINTIFNAVGGSWIAVDAKDAQTAANTGYLTVAGWLNPGPGNNHVQIVRPEPSSHGIINDNTPVVAQAGSNNFNCGNASKGNSQYKNQIYWYYYPSNK